MISRIIAIAVVLGMAGPAWAGFEEGLAAYKRFDYAAALQEWQPLAKQGDADAQFYLGEMFREGRGVRRDIAVAVDWYGKAATQGHVDAQLRLADLYETGRGVERNLAEAVKWLQEAAQGGASQAMYRLGLFYSTGDGVARDLVQAHKWFSLAARRGEDVVGFLAETRLRDVASQMTPDQIREAERLARTWKPEQRTRITDEAVEQPDRAPMPEPAG